MDWTKALPTVAGFYWYSDEYSDKPIVVEVDFFSDGAEVYFAGNDVSAYLAECVGFWIGPLDSPKQPDA